MTGNDDHYDGSLLESIKDDLKAIREGQDAMAEVPKNIRDIKERMTSVESEVNSIRLAIKDQDKHLTNHAHRISLLESRHFHHG